MKIEEKEIGTELPLEELEQVSGGDYHTPPPPLPDFWGA